MRETNFSAYCSKFVYFQRRKFVSFILFDTKLRFSINIEHKLHQIFLPLFMQNIHFLTSTILYVRGHIVWMVDQVIILINSYSNLNGNQIAAKTKISQSSHLEMDNLRTSKIAILSTLELYERCSPGYENFCSQFEI